MHKAQHRVKMARLYTKSNPCSCVERVFDVRRVWDFTRDQCAVPASSAALTLGFMTALMSPGRTIMPCRGAHLNNSLLPSLPSLSPTDKAGEAKHERARSPRKWPLSQEHQVIAVWTIKIHQNRPTTRTRTGETNRILRMPTRRSDRGSDNKDRTPAQWRKRR